MKRGVIIGSAYNLRKDNRKSIRLARNLKRRKAASTGARLRGNVIHTLDASGININQNGDTYWEDMINETDEITEEKKGKRRRDRDSDSDSDSDSSDDDSDSDSDSEGEEEEEEEEGDYEVTRRKWDSTQMEKSECADCCCSFLYQFLKLCCCCLINHYGVKDNIDRLEEHYELERLEKNKNKKKKKRKSKESNDSDTDDDSHLVTPPPRKTGEGGDEAEKEGTKWKKGKVKKSKKKKKQKHNKSKERRKDRRSDKGNHREVARSKVRSYIDDNGNIFFQEDRTWAQFWATPQGIGMIAVTMFIFGFTLYGYLTENSKYMMLDVKTPPVFIFSVVVAFFVILLSGGITFVLWKVFKNVFCCCGCCCCRTTRRAGILVSDRIEGYYN